MVACRGGVRARSVNGASLASQGRQGVRGWIGSHGAAARPAHERPLEGGPTFLLCGHIVEETSSSPPKALSAMHRGIEGENSDSAHAPSPLPGSAGGGRLGADIGCLKVDDKEAGLL